MVCSAKQEALVFSCCLELVFRHESMAKGNIIIIGSSTQRAKGTGGPARVMAVV